jgi:hypothetical protein
MDKRQFRDNQSQHFLNDSAPGRMPVFFNARNATGNGNQESFTHRVATPLVGNGRDERQLASKTGPASPMDPKMTTRVFARYILNP